MNVLIGFSQFHNKVCSVRVCLSICLTHHSSLSFGTVKMFKASTVSVVFGLKMYLVSIPNIDSYYIVYT